MKNMKYNKKKIWYPKITLSDSSLLLEIKEILILTECRLQTLKEKLVEEKSRNGQFTYNSSPTYRTCIF